MQYFNIKIKLIYVIILFSYQIKLLFYDNIPSGKYKTNVDINKNFNLRFENEVEKYCYMWKEAGEYAKKK